jgi:Spy/CpxP family protein refolding chaperone
MRTCMWAMILAVLALGFAEPPAEEFALPSDTTVKLLLLRQKSVQEELKLTPDLSAKIAEYTNKEHEEYQKALKLSAEEREKKFDELEAEHEKFLVDNLSEAQRRRLGQITMQVIGLRFLTRPKAAEVLKLTPEQQDKFKKLHAEARKDLAAIMQAEDGGDKSEKVAKLREDLDKKIEEILTDEQKAAARAHVGEPFKGKLVIEENPKDKKDK